MEDEAPITQVKLQDKIQKYCRKQAKNAGTHSL
jgi:hypothetical protein